MEYLVPVISVRRLEFEESARAIIGNRKSENTRVAYESDFDRWLRFAYATGIDPSNPSDENAAGFRNSLLSEISTESVRRVLAGVSSVFRRLLARGLVSSNPFHPDITEWPAANSIGKTAAVDDNTTYQILEAAKDSPRDFAILMILWETGLRRSSVASIRRDAMTREGEKVVVCVFVKGGTIKKAVFPKQTTDAVNRWLEIAPSSPFLFPARNLTSPIHPNRITDMVSTYSKMIGAHVHPHSFRAAFITAAYDQGIPEREIQAAAHHESPKTTQRYDRHARGTEVTSQVSSRRRETERKDA